MDCQRDATKAIQKSIELNNYCGRMDVHPATFVFSMGKKFWTGLENGCITLQTNKTNFFHGKEVDLHVKWLKSHGMAIVVTIVVIAIVVKVAKSNPSMPGASVVTSIF